MNKEENVASSSATQPLQDKEQQRDELKKKLLANISPTKRRRKGPFPAERIVKKCICHSFIDPQSKELVEYKGGVLRESSEEDNDELMESGDKKYIGVYKFYTINV